MRDRSPPRLRLARSIQPGRPSRSAHEWTAPDTINLPLSALTWVAAQSVILLGVCVVSLRLCARCSHNSSHRESWFGLDGILSEFAFRRLGQLHVRTTILYCLEPGFVDSQE